MLVLHHSPLLGSSFTHCCPGGKQTRECYARPSLLKGSHSLWHQGTCDMKAALTVWPLDISPLDSISVMTTAIFLLLSLTRGSLLWNDSRGFFFFKIFWNEEYFNISNKCNPIFIPFPPKVTTQPLMWPLRFKKKIVIWNKEYFFKTLRNISNNETLLSHDSLKK